MADTAVRPELLVNLTAALGNVSKACGLPSGWVAKPSFRITPQGASLQVVWSPAPAAREKESKAPEVKKKRRSKSSRQRSADRAAAHKVRPRPLVVPSHQQAWNPTAAIFTPNPAPPPPNSVPSVESERVRAAAEESNRSCRIIEVAEPQVPALATPEPGPQLEGCEMGVDGRGKRGREGTVTLPPEAMPLLHTLFTEYERGRGRGPFSEQLQVAILAVDSLAGGGAAQAALASYEDHVRRLN
jgi:hypothetical protein